MSILNINKHYIKEIDMAGSSLDHTSESGAYKCTKCGNLEVHVKGDHKAPCSKCGSNCNWVMETQTTNE